PPCQYIALHAYRLVSTFNAGTPLHPPVPRAHVIPLRSYLPWPTLGAIPETLQTAYGSLTTGLDLQPGQTLLIRGGTSALGLATATLAKDLDAIVLSTTRQPDRVAALKAHGVDYPILDTGQVAAEVRRIFPAGVDAAL